MAERYLPEDVLRALQGINKRLDNVERARLLLPPDADPLQTFESGTPLGDTRFLNFGAGINASLVGDDYVLVEGAAGGGGSWATVTVAAVDSHPKAQEEADFVCTGVNDEVTLHAAVAECKLRCTLPSGAITMGKVGLYQGTFYVKAPWTNTNGFTAQTMWFQGMGPGTEIRADTGFTGGGVVQMVCSYTGFAGRAICSDMYINGNNIADRGLYFNGEFSPNPTGHRQYGYNLLCFSSIQAQVQTSAGSSPATFLDNIETVGGLYGIYADGVNPSRVTNCRVQSASQYGIIARGLVQGCIATSCDAGILMSEGGVDAGTGGRCLGNWVTGGDIGIYAAGNDNVIADNTIIATGEYGIYATDDRQVIADNIVTGCGTDGTFDGIRITGDECSVWNNKVRGCTDYGISVQASATGTYIAFNDLELNTTGTIEDLGTGTVIYPQTAGDAPANADYLVGTANADLSAEIVVGTTPGGELGNTWASPTVDATHSGSAHADFLPVAGAPTGWGSVTNVTPDQVYDADSTTVNELADVLGTLIADLVARGVLDA